MKPEFKGSSNPRHLRVIHSLMARPMSREELDSRAGASNGPELVAELRRRGLSVPCQRVPVFDRDGKEVKRGIYSLAPLDRRLINRWLSKRTK